MRESFITELSQQKKDNYQQYLQIKSQLEHKKEKDERDRRKSEKE